MVETHGVTNNFIGEPVTLVANLLVLMPFVTAVNRAFHMEK